MKYILLIASFLTANLFTTSLAWAGSIYFSSGNTYESSERTGKSDIVISDGTSWKYGSFGVFTKMNKPFEGQDRSAVAVLIPTLSYKKLTGNKTASYIDDAYLTYNFQYTDTKDRTHYLGFGMDFKGALHFSHEH